MINMRMGYVRLSAAISLTLFFVSPGLAQSDPNPSVTLSFDQGLILRDNPGLNKDPSGGALATTSRLGFAYRAETRTSLLTVDGLATILGETGGGDADQFIELRRSGGIFYSRESNNQEFTVSARTQTVELDDTIVIDEEFDLPVTVDAGALVNTSASLGYRSGVGEPLDFSLGVTYTDRNYTDNLDPNFVDRTSLGADTTTRLRLTPSLRARVTAGASKTEDRDGIGTSFEKYYLGTGLEGETANGLSFVADVSAVRSGSGSNLGDLPKETATALDVSVVQDSKLGPIAFSLSSDIERVGRVSSIEVTRDIELPRGGLGFAFGAVKTADEGLEPTAGVTYSQDLKRGRFRLSMERDVQTGNVYSVSALQFVTSFQRDLSRRSRVAGSWSYAFLDPLDETINYNVLVKGRLSYIHDLSEEWKLDTGFGYLRRGNEESTDRSRNSIYLQIGRDFTFGF